MPSRVGTFRITSSNAPGLLPALLVAASEVARAHGFDDDESMKLRLAVEEAATNVIRHAFAPGEEDCFEVWFDPVPLGLQVAVREKGIPFDAARIPAYQIERAAERAEGLGLGVHLMRRMVDEVAFLNLGWQGKEVRLTKYLAQGRIHDRLSEPERDEAERQSRLSPEPAAAEPEVRRMRPGEALEIARCAYVAYRYTYAYEHIYYPERVEELNRTDRLISYVAIEPGGALVGHAALVFSDEDPGTAELAAAFVSPRCRGGGLLGRLTTALIEEGSRRGLAGVFAHGVTSHPYSQKAALKFGLRDTCLLLSAAAPLEFKALREGGGRRESVMNLFRYLHPPARLELHVPARHAEMIERLYTGLGVPARFERGEVAPPADPGHVESATDAGKVSHLRVRRIGRGSPETVRRLARSLCRERVETVYVYLPLADPGTPWLAPLLESDGFFFAGVLPGSPERDLLVLQLLNNTAVAYDKLELGSDRGRELAAYVQRCDPAAGER